MALRRNPFAIKTCFLILLSTSCQREPQPGEQQPSDQAAPRSPAHPVAADTDATLRVSSGRLYVPVYSHIYTRAGSAEDLAITLSVRNVSVTRSLVLESVRYYDTGGALLDDFLEAPATIRPLETVEFFVPTDDQRGGSGANVIATWHAESPVVKPLVEAVMVRSTAASQAYAFSTRAIEIPPDAPLPSTAAPGRSGATPAPE